MSVEPVQEREWNDLVQETLHLLRSLAAHEPAEIGKLLVSASFQEEEDTRRAVEALAFLRVAEQRPANARLHWLSSLQHGGDAYTPDVVVGGHMAVEVKHAGAARKVSVSMPEDLTAAVQSRVGRGRFSQYVTEAVTRQLELDLLAELSELLSSGYGPVSEKDLAEARAAWPDNG